MAIAGLQAGLNPLSSASRELRAGQRLDHRAVAERQHGEHLAPRDLAGLLAAPTAARAAGPRAGRPSWSARRRRPDTWRASRRRPGCPSPTRSGGSGRAGCRPPASRSPRCAAPPSRRWRRRRSPARPARAATPRFLATRVAVPAHATSPPLTISCATRVAAAGVEALDDRDVADDRVGDRCVWPAITRSTVVSCSADDVDDRALPRLGRVAVDRVGAEHGALVDDHDLHPHAAARGAARTRAGCARASSRKSRPCGGVGAHELRRRAHRRADHADADAVDAEDRRRLQPVGCLPVASSTMLAERNGKSARAWWAQDPLHAEVELVVAEARGVQPPRVLDVDRRPVLEQRGVRRRRADVVARREQQRPAGQRRGLLVEHRRQLRRAADGHVEPVDRRRRRLELAVEVVQPDDRQRRVAAAARRAGRAARRPGCAAAPGCRAGTPPSARGRCCARRAPRRARSRVPPARNVARMFVLRVEVLHVRARSRAGRRRPSGRSACPASPRRTGTAAWRRPRGRRCASGAPCRPCWPAPFGM